MSDVKLVNGVDLAPHAEALKVRTNQIIGAVRQDDIFVVLYTPYMKEDSSWKEDPEQCRVFRALLEPDEDDILRLVKEPEESPETWEKMKPMLGL